MNDFHQPLPELHNQYLDDEILQKYIHKMLPKGILNEIEPDLIRFGQKCIEEYPQHALDSERNPPKLESYDVNGNEVHELRTTSGWKFFKKESAIERTVAIAYAEKYKKYDRLYQFIKMYLYNPSNGLFSCPLAMTDGAAYLIKYIKENRQDLLTDSMKEAFNRITSTNPDFFWTSGQWMTEKRGGSDVRLGTMTTAKKISGNLYELNGLKWFTSAIDADVSFTLAKIKNNENEDLDNINPTLFFVRLRDNKGKLNNIFPVRLKDKLGTRQVPTAELLLQGTVAEIASPEGKGLSYIMNLANITRLHNIVSAVGFIRRAVAIVESYSFKRIVFGKYLKDHSLHINTFSKMKFILEGCLLLTLHLGKLQGICEYEKSNFEKSELLKILLPLSKLFTGKMSSHVVAEGMECLGGLGYLENSGFPNILRDAFVLSIWEGTTNVLSIEFSKFVSKKNWDYLFKKMEKNIEKK